MDKAKQRQEVQVTSLGPGEVFVSFVAPISTFAAAELCSVAWGQPNGWCINVLVALGLDAVREKGLQRDPMPWITKQTTDLKAEIDAQG